jgi:hypothetical protein
MFRYIQLSRQKAGYAITKLLQKNHRQYYIFFNILKNRAESLLESKVKAKYDFKKFLSLFSTRWNGFLCPQKVENLLYCIEEWNFFLKMGHVGYKKYPSFYVDSKNVWQMTKCT